MAETWGDAIRYFRETDGLKERAATLSDDELQLVIQLMLDKIIEEKRLSGTSKVNKWKEAAWPPPFKED